MFTALTLLALFDPAADLHRFPPADVAKDAWMASQSHLCALHDRMNQTANLRYAEALNAWHADARYCYLCWNELDNAHRAPVQGRQEALAKLRILLGDRDYLAGRMPCVLPWWRYVQID